MGYTVFSAFDGMSCGQIAFKKLGIKVYKYYASEVDKYAIMQTQQNFPEWVDCKSYYAHFKIFIMRILKESWECENTHKDEYLIIDNISFVSSMSCRDCSFYETIKLSFEPCNEKGRTFVPSSTRFILMIEVNSGYLPVDNGIVTGKQIGRAHV